MRVKRSIFIAIYQSTGTFIGYVKHRNAPLDMSCAVGAQKKAENPRLGSPWQRILSAFAPIELKINL